MFELLLTIAPTFSCAEVEQLMVNLQRADGLTPVEKRDIARQFMSVAPPNCDINFCDYL